MAKPFQVRPFGAHDIASLWRLMIALAEFEGYADKFAVSEADLAAYGLGNAPRFSAFVAAMADRSSWAWRSAMSSLGPST